MKNFDANKVRTASGRYASALPPLTEARLAAMIDGATKLAIPPELKPYWRRWPLERRGEFVRRLRAKLQPARERPATPFSANVEPFDYASPRAWEIVRRMNAGLDSQHAAIKLNITSQGVIWRGSLWFWVSNTGYVRGQWTPEETRPILHRCIWSEHHGRPLTADMVIWFLDGNDNNLAPENLALATKDDICRKNQAVALRRKSREQTALLLRFQQQQTQEKQYANTIQKLRRA